MTNRGVIRITTVVSICVFAILLGGSVSAQEGEMPAMTPDQQAEMEAYMKAGALGSLYNLGADPRLNHEIDVVPRELTKLPPDEYLPYRVNGKPVPEFARAGDGHRFHATGLTHDERGYPAMNAEAQDKLIRRLCSKVLDHTEEISLYETLPVPPAPEALARLGARRLPGSGFPETLKKYGAPGVLGPQAEGGNLATHNLKIEMIDTKIAWCYIQGVRCQ